MSSTQTPAPSRRDPWGLFATIAFTVVIAGVFLLAQLAVAVPYIIYKVAGTPKPDIQAAASGLQSDGLVVAVAELVAGSLSIAFILFITWIRRGPSVHEYLGLRPAPRITTLRWLLYTVVFGVLLDGITSLAGLPVVPEWMEAAFNSAVYLPLFLLAILVVAPILEELLFRGFLFEGIRRSPLGDAGAILLTSLPWAAIHLQYEWFYIGQVFLLGLLLGAARVRTRSLVPPILMHTLFSGIATLQVMIESRR